MTVFSYFEPHCGHLMNATGLVSSKIRRKFSDNPLGKPPADFEDFLEAHVRKYLIDALLGALNWSIVLQDDPAETNLIPEAPIVSVTHATTRYLDYFGMEHGTGQALLILESKRLGTPLPERKKSTPARKLVASRRDVAEIILGGLKGDGLLHNWDGWLKTLTDYFVTVRDRGQSAPRRVVITDGIWCIIFLEPETTLLDPDRSAPEHIAVYLSKESAAAGRVFETYFDEIFGYLEYRCLARQLRSLTVAELNFHLPRGTQTTMMRGLHLKYLEVEELYSTKPRIQVSPLLFIRAEGREWLRVEARTPEYVPTNEDDLAQHLETVRARAQQLSDDVTTMVEKKPTWLSIEDHYGRISDLLKFLVPKVGESFVLGHNVESQEVAQARPSPELAGALETILELAAL